MKHATHLTALFSLTLLACTGSDQTADTANTEAPAVAESEVTEETPDAKSRCAEVFVRQRECTDDFIPALVDARIRLDVPAGIAARATDEGRASLISEAMGEWADDSQDAAIDATCDKIVASVPAESLEPMLTASRDCLEEGECTAFAACIVPVIEGQLK